ncbi:hypothetical protein KP78_38390 [Jeotgalibacillus soli]|uniref:Nudix hydrolase domain-containing protein n=1 Tax=Jeotgalibacillus soli TaxID=889306 RepID=A0A0C2VDI7_9BACL|nr:NUDIX hydrolase [Jeotgalibacillus soli]KIL42616.1 hypothetical protein KP78_38390 [Jeotgalibacillus soli]
MTRGNVWLAVAGLVENDRGEWLVVKKKYGGLKGTWSLPAGFVNMGETIDQAVQREVLEETGIKAEVLYIMGVRTGVIKNQISDNMIIFSMRPVEENHRIQVQEDELEEVAWMEPSELALRNDISKMLPKIVDNKREFGLMRQPTMDPGKQFQYTHYQLFL